MRRLVAVSVLGAALTLPTTAFAQTGPQSSSDAASTGTRAATTTASGTTGLWYVPTSEILPAKKWSASFYRTNIDDGQGFSDIATFPATFAVGVANRAEVFGSWTLVTRIDRDSRPLFFSGEPNGKNNGTGGGILVDYPLDRQQWFGNKRGDLWVGGKINLLSTSGAPVGVAVRAMAKLPVGDKDAGASSGVSDFQVDGIVSARNAVVELSGFGGVIVRGQPDGYTLTNGVRWGVGAAFPQRFSLGFRFTAELFGERYFNDTITAPAGLTGSDGSPVPTITGLRDPIVTSIGLTWQAPGGFFIGAAGSWNIGMTNRDGAGFPDTPKDDKGLQVRLGFHPGVRNRGSAMSVAPPPPPGGPGASRPGAGGAAPAAGGPGAGTSPGGGVAGPPAGASAGGPAGPGAGAAGPGAGAPAGGGIAGGPGSQNRPPTVRASCNPCSVEVGRSATVSADAQDPDGDPLTYQWTNASGTLANPTSRQSPWTAPMQIGPVPFTVTVNDGKGGTARDTVTIQVTQPVQQQYTFEDVHFEFDRYTLRPDALSVLDAAVTAMRANPNLRLTIEGHTCNIGTAEYNLALGERRARAVRDYLTSRGISAERLSTVSYGEERPEYDNAREETRRLNRRAALVVKVQ